MNFSGRKFCFKRGCSEYSSLNKIPVTDLNGVYHNQLDEIVGDNVLYLIVNV